MNFFQKNKFPWNSLCSGIPDAKSFKLLPHVFAWDALRKSQNVKKKKWVNIKLSNFFFKILWEQLTANKTVKIKPQGLPQGCKIRGIMKEIFRVSHPKHRSKRCTITAATYERGWNDTFWKVFRGTRGEVKAQRAELSWNRLIGTWGIRVDVFARVCG